MNLDLAYIDNWSLGARREDPAPHDPGRPLRPRRAVGALDAPPAAARAWREDGGMPGATGASGSASCSPSPALVAALAALARFLEWNEARPGATLSDPVLALFAPRDLTWLDVRPRLPRNRRRGRAPRRASPRALVLALQAYALMVLLTHRRDVGDAARGAARDDPAGGPRSCASSVPARLLTKDLFFSGPHVDALPPRAHRAGPRVEGALRRRDRGRGRQRPRAARPLHGRRPRGAVLRVREREARLPPRR